MNTTFTAGIVFGSLIAAVLIGRILRRVLPETHLNAESKDAVKLAMGLVATMSALILGLLVSSAKGAYDTERNEVIQMAAKITFLDRVLFRLVLFLLLKDFNSCGLPGRPVARHERP